MTDTIFLEPVAPSKRIIFVDIRNTSLSVAPIRQIMNLMQQSQRWSKAWLDQLV